MRSVLSEFENGSQIYVFYGLTRAEQSSYTYSGEYMLFERRGS